MVVRGALPGQYACVVAPSRRNSFSVSLRLEAELLRAITRVGRRMATAFAPKDDTPCLKMIAGVTLNGRKYAQGDRQVPHSLTYITCVCM